MDAAADGNDDPHAINTGHLQGIIDLLPHLSLPLAGLKTGKEGDSDRAIRSTVSSRRWVPGPMP
jgi:hypothetical protein